MDLDIYIDDLYILRYLIDNEYISKSQTRVIRARKHNIYLVFQIYDMFSSAFKKKDCRTVINYKKSIVPKAYYRNRKSKLQSNNNYINKN